MYHSPPGSSVHGVLPERILQWIAPSFSRGSFQTRDWTHVSCTDRRILYHWATTEAPIYLPLCNLLALEGTGVPLSWYMSPLYIVAVVQSPSCVRLFVTPWTAACQASLSFTISWSLPKFMSTTLVMPSSHLILWHPLLLLPSIFPSIRDFSNESAVCIRWPKYWSFNFSISPSNEYSGLISHKIDWFDLIAIQRTLRSLLQHHSSKASILQCSAFFMVQLSQPHVNTAKTTALTMRTSVGRVMSVFQHTA